MLETYYIVRYFIEWDGGIDKIIPIEGPFFNEGEAVRRYNVILPDHEGRNLSIYKVSERAELVI
jgi:hypothetical protein